MNIDQQSLWDALPDNIRQYANNKTSLKKRPHRACAVALEYAEMTICVFKVRVMASEYAPRTTDTRRGFRVRNGTRRSFRVRVIVLWCSPGF